MFRSLLLKASEYAKADGLVDKFVRYNPVIRRQISTIINQTRSLPPAPSHASLTAFLTERTLQAARRTRYGAEREAFDDWPLLTKSTVRDMPQNFVNPGSWLRMPAATGGTTGTPMKLWRSLESVVAEQMFLDELLEPYGYDMRQSRVAVLRFDSVKPSSEFPHGKLSHNNKRLTLCTPQLNSRTFPLFYDALQQFAPQVLWVYPNTALNLLKLIQSTGQNLEIPIILASSETMSGSLHRTLEAAFKSKVINYYGQGERVCFAHSTEPGVFYFNPRYGRVEFRDSDLTDASSRSLEIIGTNYWNMAMPLVRYRTGDLIRVPSDYGVTELDEVATGKRPFPEILGRDQEYLLTREGLHIVGLNNIPKEISNIFQIQLVQQDYDTAVIRVAAMPGYSERDAKDLLAHARVKIPTSIDIKIETADHMLVNRRGKAPYVLRLFEHP